MKFFDQQSLKRRQSFLLLMGFVAAFVATGFVIHLVIAGLFVVFGEATIVSEPSTPALVLILLVWIVIAMGAFFRFLDVKAGAEKLAKRLGAVQVSDRSCDENEQQLLNVVAEISIASGIAQPIVYVLRRETSINAFVLGTQPQKNKAVGHVLVITQAALNHFSRDELKAVVAHEYAHIANEDLRLNMHLLIALGGLLAIDEVGRFLVGEKFKYGRNMHSHAAIVFRILSGVGYLFQALGSIGVFFGQLISSAFSRQREYLADACAVQYTRNPYALASALNVIKLQNEESALHNIYEQELAHFCIQSGKPKRWFNRLLASHPPLQSRMNLIDPNFSAKNRKARNAKRNKKQSSFSQTLSSSGQYVATDMTVLAPLSDGAQIVLADTAASMAVLFAIFVNEEVSSRRSYLNAAAFAFSKEFAGRVKNLHRYLAEDLNHNPSALIDLAAKTLCDSMSTEDRQTMLGKLEGIVSSANDYDLMKYATLQLIRRKLGLEFPVLKSFSGDHLAVGSHVKSFESMGREFALLLSLIVESSGASESLQNLEFERVMKSYTSTVYPRRFKSEKGIVSEVATAFQMLFFQPKAVREEFLQHCVEIVKNDGYVARTERALIELFAASLGCTRSIP